MSETKRVYAFGKGLDGVNTTEGNKDMKYQLGGKGANLAEMANIGLPVPPGFTITCQACVEYYGPQITSATDKVKGQFPDGLMDEIAEHVRMLEAKMGKRLGDPGDPCSSRCVPVRRSRCRA